MFRWIIISILSLGVIGTTYWGYQEHQEKNAILIQAENTYQRAFHELTYHIDLLHDKIGSSLAMNSNDSLSPQLVEIWRITADAHANVGQLPLSLLPFNKTEEFLANIGNFTYRVAVRDLETDPLNEDELATLEGLYEQSGEIKDELRQVQHTALSNNLRWMDVQLALATEDEQMDNTIVDGFQTVEKKVEGYSEAANFDTLIGDHTSEVHDYLFVNEEPLTEEEIIERSKEIFDVKSDENLSITKSGDGADISVYSVSYQNEQKYGYMDITEQGGHPITLLINRPINEKNLSLYDGLQEATNYLEEYEFDNMVVFQSTQYDNIGVYSFLYAEDDVRIHSDSVEIKIALDDGDILGLSAKNYLMNHRQREIPQPALSPEEAKEQVNSQVEIQEEFLAIIDNEFGEEVLVYEFLGILNDDTFRIFINAMDGREEKVEKLMNSELNFAQGL